MPQVIIVGGGLAGVAAAHTALEGGASVCLIDKMAFLGGNSVKATSGINGALTNTQIKLGVPDSKEIFEEDTVRSATGVKKGPCPPSYPLAVVQTHTSADGVHWLQSKFGLKLDVVSRLGGHSQPRTHRSSDGGKFPGMEITSTLINRLEELSVSDPSKVRLINKARVTRLLKNRNGAVIGCEYEKGGKTFKEAGSVIVCTGGYGAGMLSKDSPLGKIRPDLMGLPTTNGVHCTGDALKFVVEAGGDVVDLQDVQVHPTGLVDPKNPDSTVKFLAAEALRGSGGILLDKDGRRFVDDLGKRDHVSGNMWRHNNGPYRLVLNDKASDKIAWHCAHYTGRGVMQQVAPADLHKVIGCPRENLEQTFREYNAAAKAGTDQFDTKFFAGAPWNINQKKDFFVAHVTPIVHYCMGGLRIDEPGRIMNKAQQAIPGLYSAGEAAGGIHGRNRLGGSALGECVAFGRVAGAHAAQYEMSTGVREEKLGEGSATAGGAVTISIESGGSTVNISIGADGSVNTGAGSSQVVDLESAWDLDPNFVSSTGNVPGYIKGTFSAPLALDNDPAPSAAPAAVAPAKPTAALTAEEVAKHTSEDDCWVIVNGQVLDVTSFLDDHPGGKMALMTFAGRDATEEFNMLHDKNTVEKYASEIILGPLVPGKAKL
jgi:flavocytochrome c